MLWWTATKHKLSPFNTATEFMHQRYSKALLLFSLPLLLAACGEKQEPAPQLTPQQMHERVQALLKPNVESSATEYKEALSLLQRSAAAGYLPAQVDWAGVLLEGSKDGSVHKDPEQAFQWYSRAAKRGSLVATHNCGMILRDKGLLAEAIPYFRTAALGGVPESQYQLGRILLQQGNPEALGFIRKAAESNSAATVAAAAFTLGHVYGKGKAGVPVDAEQSTQWYIRSANAGDPRALYMVGMMYLVGDGVPQDAQKGESMLRMSAGQDYLPAIRILIDHILQSPEEIAAWQKREQDLSKNKQ